MLYRFEVGERLLAGVASSLFSQILCLGLSENPGSIFVVDPHRRKSNHVAMFLENDRNVLLAKKKICDDLGMSPNFIHGDVAKFMRLPLHGLPPLVRVYTSHNRGATRKNTSIAEEQHTCSS